MVGIACDDVDDDDDDSEIIVSFGLKSAERYTRCELNKLFFHLII